MASTDSITFPAKSHNHDTRYKTRKAYDISKCYSSNVIATHSTPHLYTIDNLGIFILDAHINIKTELINGKTDKGYLIFDNMPVNFLKTVVVQDIITSQERADYYNGKFTAFFHWFGTSSFLNQSVYFNYYTNITNPPTQVNCPFKAIGFFNSFNSSSPATT